jgi:hypothetical protein
MKSAAGPTMTLGNAAAARVRLIVWCRDCGHQVEPDTAEQAQRYGSATPVLDWRERLICSKCGAEKSIWSRPALGVSASAAVTA